MSFIADIGNHVHILYDIHRLTRRSSKELLRGNQLTSNKMFKNLKLLQLISQTITASHNHVILEIR